MRSPISAGSFPRESHKPFFRLAFGGLSLAILTVVLGCSKSPYSVGYTDVSGKVLLDGKPLPGGQVSFVAVNGDIASRGDIGEDGKYQIKAPIGEVRIGIDNSLLKPPDPGRGRPPKGMLHGTKQGFVKDPDKPPLKGRYVALPTTYMDPALSGLKYTVKPGSQTYDIQLSKTPPKSSGTP